MTNNKTTENSMSVNEFINSIKNETQKNDCWLLIEFLGKITGMEPKMWGTSIIGFGSYHYKYDSGHTGDSPLVAFSPRTAAISIYLSGNFENRPLLLEQLGKHKAEKGCIYVKKLEDIHLPVLQEMVNNHIRHICALYPAPEK